MNAANLRKTADAIEVEAQLFPELLGPLKFDMMLYAEKEACGTSCCIAGMAAFLRAAEEHAPIHLEAYDDTKTSGEWFFGADQEDAEDYAITWLDLTWEEAEIFYRYETPRAELVAELRAMADTAEAAA